MIVLSDRPMVEIAHLSMEKQQTIDHQIESEAY